FFFNDTATTEIYTLSLHDALPISRRVQGRGAELRLLARRAAEAAPREEPVELRSVAEGARGAEGAGAERRAAAGRVRRPAGRQGAGRIRRARAADDGGVHRALPLDPLRVALRPVGDHRQPARRGHHPGVLRLLPVGVLAAGARRGARG